VLFAPGTVDQLLRAGEQGSQRAAEPLREAESDRVEARGDLGGLDLERRRGVE
jgi:hypothetical protein